MRTLPIGDDRVGASTTGDEIVVRSPYDGHEIDRVPACGRRRGGARRRERGGGAPRRSAARRGSGPRSSTAPRGCSAERTEEFARIIAEEAAKPIKTARVEANACGVDVHVRGHRGPAAGGRDGAARRGRRRRGQARFHPARPVGVVGAISPFNFPLNLVAHKLAPAIAAGCPVVLKPASQTPLSAIALAELLLDECGLPAGHLNVVTGGGGTVGNAIVDDPDIALITFTGSPEVGWGIRARAPHKKVGLELGNNAPVIVEPDGDVTTAATKISVAGFSHAGQSCISTQRVYLHEAIADAFLDVLLPRVEALVVGDPLDEATDVSALISRGERDRVESWIDEAVAAGAKVAAGGTERNGVLAPTVLTNVQPDMKVCSQEVFGPVVAVQTYTDVDDAFGSPTRPATASRPPSSPATCRSPCVPRASSTSAACW